MIDSSDRPYGPYSTGDFELDIKSITDAMDNLSIALKKLKHKTKPNIQLNYIPKHHLKKPQTNRISTNTRNQLRCKRKLKQSIRGRKND